MNADVTAKRLSALEARVATLEVPAPRRPAIHRAGPEVRELVRAWVDTVSDDARTALTHGDVWRLEDQVQRLVDDGAS